MTEHMLSLVGCPHFLPFGLQSALLCTCSTLLLCPCSISHVYSYLALLVNTLMGYTSRNKGARLTRSTALTRSPLADLATRPAALGLDSYLRD